MQNLKILTLVLENLNHLLPTCIPHGHQMIILQILKKKLK